MPPRRTYNERRARAHLTKTRPQMVLHSALLHAYSPDGFLMVSVGSLPQCSVVQSPPPLPGPRPLDPMIMGSLPLCSVVQLFSPPLTGPRPLDPTHPPHPTHLHGSLPQCSVVQLFSVQSTLDRTHPPTANGPTLGPLACI